MSVGYLLAKKLKLNIQSGVCVILKSKRSHTPILIMCLDE